MKQIVNETENLIEASFLPELVKMQPFYGSLRKKDRAKHLNTGQGKWIQGFTLQRQT